MYSIMPRKLAFTLFIILINREVASQNRKTIMKAKRMADKGVIVMMQYLGIKERMVSVPDSDNTDHELPGPEMKKERINEKKAKSIVATSAWRIHDTISDKQFI